MTELGPRTESERRAYQEGILHGVRMSIERIEEHGVNDAMADLKSFVIAFEKLSNETVTEADMPLCKLGPGGDYVEEIHWNKGEGLTKGGQPE